MYSPFSGKMKYYAGIGSRETPLTLSTSIQRIVEWCEFLKII
jgi:hypothetical protein